MLMTLYCLGMCCHSRRRRYRIWFQRQSSDELATTRAEHSESLTEL